MPETPNAPQVSIIIPVYNAAPYLRRCLDSVAAQTLADWECICVDDASTDGSGAILDEYAARDSRFVVIHKKENSGAPSAGRNAGLDAARGEWIGFVDNDDWIEPETYELALDAARRHDADIVQWRNTVRHEEGLAASPELPEGLFDARQNLAYFDVHIWIKLFRASLVRDVRFPAGAKIGKEDNIFSIITYVLAERCYFLDRVLYCHDITHDHLMLRKHTAETVKSIAYEVQKMCAIVEKARAEQKNRRTEEQKNRRTEEQNISWLLFSQKVSAKNMALYSLPQRDYRLFRSIFPDLKWEAARWLFKSRSKRALIALLYSWRLNLPAKALVRRMKWLARAIMRDKAALRRLAGRQ